MSQSNFSLPLPVVPAVAGMELSGIHDLFLRGQGRADLIPLWVGEGDQPTPAFIAEAAKQALDAGHTGYPPKRGLPVLRQAIAAYESRLHGAEVRAEQISIVASGMAGVATLMQCFVDPGDAVAIILPLWPNAAAAVKLRGGRVLPIVLQQAEDGGFHLDLDQVEAVLKQGVKALFCASPGNPSGWVASRAEQEALLQLCREHGVWLVADEVYTRLYYGADPGPGGAAPSLLTIAQPGDPLIILQSFSKTWAMTGWRMGWLVHPPGFGDLMEVLLEYTNSGSSHFSQYGCLAAITQGEAFVAEQVAHCRQQRDLVVQSLASLPGVTLKAPEGAFYALFRVAGMSDSLARAQDILEKTGVGLAPGSAFGAGGEGHMRLCFAASQKTVAAGLERLADYFSREP
ncbi:MAG: pyridoxal phosphate-dependent aminotransferase [Pseudomonadota bacterium]